MCPGKCSHSLGMRLLKEGNLKEGNLLFSFFSKEKSRTVNSQSPPSSLTPCCTGKGSQGQQRISKPESQLGLSSLPHVTVTPCRAIPAGELAPRLPRIWSLGVKGHFSQLRFKSSKINQVQEEQEQTFSSSSHCPGGARRGLA